MARWRLTPFRENVHRNHILDVTAVPAEIGEPAETSAREIACAVAEKLEPRGACSRWRCSCCTDGEHPDQRTGAAAAQFRALHFRRERHEPVRAAVARGLRTAAGLDGFAAAGGDGESAGRSLGAGGAGLAGGGAFPGGEDPPLRKERGAAGAKNGASHGVRERPREKRCGRSARRGRAWHGEDGNAGRSGRGSDRAGGGAAGAGGDRGAADGDGVRAGGARAFGRRQRRGFSRRKSGRGSTR